jgi:hypothetical protein
MTNVFSKRNMQGGFGKFQTGVLMFAFRTNWKGLSSSKQPTCKF